MYNNYNTKELFVKRIKQHLSEYWMVYAMGAGIILLGLSIVCSFLYLIYLCLVFVSKTLLPNYNPEDTALSLLIIFLMLGAIFGGSVSIKK